MANRKNTLLIKRSNVPGKVPLPGDLQLGELALNTADVVLYASGTTTNEILPIGWDRLSTLSGGTVNGNITSTGYFSGTTYYGDGSNLTGIPDYYVTGGTYSGGTLTLDRQNGSVTITGFTNSSLSATSLYVDYIDFNTGATVTQSPGRISWDSGTGTLNVAVGDTTTGLIDLQVGQEEIVRVYNDEVTTLQKGEIVYVSGSQGNRPKVKRASAVSDGYSVTTLGMVDLAIPSGSEGYVTTFGIISNLNTLGLTGGTPIWLSPTVPGGYTSTKPIAPFHTVLIGYVVRVSATVGSIFVNISNGWELDELHDVRISAATEGDLLVRSSYSGTPVWVNSKILNGNYTISGNTSQIGDFSVTGTVNTDTIQLNTSYTGSTSVGELSWSQSDGTLNIKMGGGNVTQQVGQEQYYQVINSTVATGLTNGYVISAAGVDNLTGKITAQYMIANGTIPYSYTLGVATEDILSGNTGLVTNFGLVRDIDTTGALFGETWLQGDILYVSPTIPGGLTNVVPQSPNLKIEIALVLTVGAINGSLFVRPSLGAKLSDLHNVKNSGSESNGDLLFYSAGTTTWVYGKTLNGNYQINGDLTIPTGILSATTINSNAVNSNTINVLDLNVTNDLNVTGDTNLSNVLISSLTANTLSALTITTDSLSATTDLWANYIDLNTTYTGSSVEGRISWDVNDGTIRVGMGGGNVNQQVGLEQYYLVSNISGITLTEGYVVRAAGTDPINERIIGDLMIADGSIPSKFTLGIATENISSGNTGYVTSFGIVRGINATGSLFSETWNNGDILYVSPTILGGLTNVEPLSPDLKVEIAFVLDNSVNGSIFVRPSIFPRIEDLTDVQTTGATTGDIIVYNSSNNLWEHTTTLTASGYTINGNLTVTGTTDLTDLYVDDLYVTNLDSTNISGDSYTILTPTENNTLDDFLVIDSDGNFFTRNFNSINYIPNVVTVSLSGGSSDFTSIKSAVDSITAATSTNPWLVKVGPGTYNEDPITTKPFVAIVGDSSVSTIVNANDPNQSLFLTSDNTFISDMLIQGCTGTNVAAVLYSSSTVTASNAIVYIENVRFGANYTHVKNNPFGGGNTAIQCTNIKYGAQPFTLGFYMTSDGSSTGRFQLRNVTTTAGGVANTTGLTFAKVDQPNCTIIGNLVTVTKAGSAPVSGIGFQVENGGLLRLNGFNIQRFGTGIYAPQVGSAPTIDAVGLNFENCTTDVDIIHSGATGKVNGTDNFLKTKINIDAPIYEVNTDPREIIVAKKGGDFSSIKSAVDYLVASATTSSSSRYIISVGPGIFTENEIDLTNTPYVSIVGSNIQTTLIRPATNSQHIIKVGINNEISFLSLSGAPSGYAGLYLYDIGDFGQAHKISMYDCDTNVWVESDTQDTKFYGEYLDFNGEYTYGTKVVGNNGYLALANMENYFNFPTGTGVTYCNYATGSGATINTFVGDTVSNGVSGSTAFYIQDGAELNASTLTSDGFTYGILNPNIGDPIRFDVDNASFVNGEWDLYVERNGTFGTFGGSSSHQKIFTNSPDVYWSFLDIDDGELDITRKASVTFADGTHTDFTTLLFEGSTMGLIEGGHISEVSGLTINVAEGFGYLHKSVTPEVHVRVDWLSANTILTSGSSLYVYYNENSVLSISGSKPSSTTNIILGRVVTDETSIRFIDSSPVFAEHTSNRFDELFSEAMGPIYATGSIVTEGITPFTIDVTQGDYFYSTNQYLPIGGTGLTFTQYYRDGAGDWITTATTIVNNTSYDGNGVLSALTSGYFTKHTLYLVGDGVNEQYMLVLGQNEYPTLIQTENALLATPPSFFNDSVVQIANIYIQQGTTGITQVEDIRPTIAFRAGGVNASSVHGNLLGLSADDHTQYLLVDGGRAMSGNLDMGSNDITNVGLVDGVTVSAHATRHQFGGADPVGSTTPSANAIPYADVNGLLDSWVSTASTTTLGKVKLSTAPTSASNPIVVSTTDPGYTKAITGLTYGSNVLTGTSVDGSVTTTTIGLRTKAGTVAGASFAGNPKKFTVTFTTAYPNTNYSIQITGAVNRTFTYESKSTTGFVINSNANTAFAENVDWITIGIGES